MLLLVVVLLLLLLRHCHSVTHERSPCLLSVHSHKKSTREPSHSSRSLNTAALEDALDASSSFTLAATLAPFFFRSVFMYFFFFFFINEGY